MQLKMQGMAMQVRLSVTVTNDSGVGGVGIGNGGLGNGDSCWKDGKDGGWRHADDVGISK